MSYSPHTITLIYFNMQFIKKHFLVVLSLMRCFGAVVHKYNKNYKYNITENLIIISFHYIWFLDFIFSKN